jgi:hypothetical protein
VIARFGDWQLTARGRLMWPLDPRPDEIDIRDIAHHLARICRWGGAVTDYYSVAEHSVMLARHFCIDQERGLARWALLHDAAEAYLGDIVRPLKPYFYEAQKFEGYLERMIWQRFGLDGDLPDEVKRADTAILGDERDQLFGETSAHAERKREGETGLGLVLRQWGPKRATEEFLCLFGQLFPEWRVP